MPADGNAGGIVVKALLFVPIILLITDFTGLTDVFPFVKIHYRPESPSPYFQIVLGSRQAVGSHLMLFRDGDNKKRPRLPRTAPMRPRMQPKPESRKPGRINQKGIIMLEDDLGVTPYYAVSYNRSEWGMHFKSLFEFHRGAQVFIRIDDYTVSQNRVPARVVWCKPIEDSKRFRYEVGVEFLRQARDADLKIPPPAALKRMSRNGTDRQGSG
jgi:hypothetical protein